MVLCSVPETEETAEEWEKGVFLRCDTGWRDVEQGKRFHLVHRILRTRRMSHLDTSAWQDPRFFDTLALETQLTIFLYSSISSFHKTFLESS